MFKFVFILPFLFLSIYADDFNLKPFKTELVKVEDIYGYVLDSPKIKLYSSGVVVHNFGTSQSILAKVSVIAKENGLAKLQFGVFDMLEQSALPLPNAVPQPKDEVILNFLYDRALIIAPNEEDYRLIENQFPNIYFTHIDVFGAQLIRTSKAAPTRSDFKTFCANNASGVLVFALKDKAVFVDCQDFKILYSSPLKTSNTQTELPFYSRIKGYRNEFFDFNSPKVKDYYQYYNSLLGLK